MKRADGTAARTDLVDYHLENSCTWNGRRLKHNHALLNHFIFRFFPEFKFKSSTWYDFVRRHFAELVRHNVQYNVAVTEVDYSGERVQVKTANSQR